MTLEDHVKEFNREKEAEAGVALGVGLVSCLVVFALVFWFGWLFSIFALRMDSRTALFGLGAGILFLGLSVWYAWRQVDPISRVDLRLSEGEEAMRDMETAMGYHLGVPIVRRDSLAWTATIMIGGPANVFDAWAIWNARLALPPELLKEAAQLLASSVKGVRLDSVPDKRAVVLLHRLALVKATHGPDGQLILMPTQKGLAAIG